MTAPAGAEVGLYVDLIAPVHVGDVIETRSGRRYIAIAVRIQDRGKHRGRQHLRVIVLGEGDPITRLGDREPSVHRIRWYVRRGGGVKGKGRR